MKRYDKYISAVTSLNNYKAKMPMYEEMQDSDTKSLIYSGYINHYQHTFELSWKICKQLMGYEGIADAETGSPNTILRACLHNGYIDNWNLWKKALTSRNDWTHIYSGDDVEDAVKTISTDYVPMFNELADKVEEKIVELYNDGLIPEAEIDDTIIELAENGKPYSPKR